MTFCPNCQRLNSNSATSCQWCGSSLVMVTVREIPQKDTSGVILGILVLTTLVMPWVVGSGNFTVSGSSANVYVVSLAFPFAEYSYSPTLNQGSWSGYIPVLYVAPVFVMLGGALIIGGYLSDCYRKLVGLGAMFSALAPVALLGFSESSTATLQNITVSGFVAFPVAAGLPILFGLLAMARSGKDPQPRGYPPSTFQNVPYQQRHPVQGSFCPNCGTSTPADHRFCVNCGTNLAAYHAQLKTPLPE